MKRRLHYEETFYSFVFAPYCWVPKLLRSRRTNDSDDHNHDSRNDRAAADVGYADDHDPLLIGSFLPATRKGHATACPYFYQAFSGLEASAVWASSSA